MTKSEVKLNDKSLVSASKKSSCPEGKESSPSNQSEHVNVLKELLLKRLEIESKVLKKSFQISCDGAEEMESIVSQENDIIRTIPMFWREVFKNSPLLAMNSWKCDEPILCHLTTIDVVWQRDPMGFSLVFHFSQNEFFTNSTLTKHFSMRCDPDKLHPLDFRGMQIFACDGCEINWKTGKNVTLQLVEKEVTTAGDGGFEEMAVDSFFHFFSPIEVPQGSGRLVDETNRLLLGHFQLGYELAHNIVPRAIWYFTGGAEAEANNDDDGLSQEARISMAKENMEKAKQELDVFTSLTEEKITELQRSCGENRRAYEALLPASKYHRADALERPAGSEDRKNAPLQEYGTNPSGSVAAGDSSLGEANASASTGTSARPTRKSGSGGKELQAAKSSKG